MQLGRSWGWILAFGLVTLAAGIVTIVWPGSGLFAIAVVVGVQLIVNGVFRLGVAFSEEGQRQRGWLIFVGVLSLITGMLCLLNIFQTIVALTILVGVFWTVSGVLHLMGAFSSPDLPNRGWAIFNGLLSVIAGIVIFAFPINSAFALAIVLGAWLAILGIMEIGASMRLRRLSSTVEEFRGRGAVAPAG